MSIIQAMGATHINKPRLMQIVDVMNKELKLFSVFGDKDSPGLDRVSPELDRIRQMYEPKINTGLLDKLSYVAEVKFDGYSYLCVGGRFISRRPSQAQGNVGRPIDKTDHVPHLAKIFGEIRQSIEFDIHGELYRPGGISDDVTRIMGCDPDEAVARQLSTGKLHYIMYDIRSYRGQKVINEPYYVRRAILEYFYERHIVSKGYDGYIKLAPILSDPPQQAFKGIVTSGGEGLIIKPTKHLYVPGKKPTGSWIKCKKQLTADVVIMGYNDGTGKNSDIFGSIRFGMYVNGKLTEMGNVSSGLSDEVRQMIWDNADKYVGMVIEIDAMEQSKLSFRNPVFVKVRYDKGAEECNIEDSIRIKEEMF